MTYRIQTRPGSESKDVTLSTGEKITIPAETSLILADEQLGDGMYGLYFRNRRGEGLSADRDYKTQYVSKDAVLELKKLAEN